jgi:hypothetical protein
MLVRGVGALERNPEAAMVQYSPYEFSETEVAKLTEYLKNVARQERVVHYEGCPLR